MSVAWSSGSPLTALAERRSLRPSLKLTRGEKSSKSDGPIFRRSDEFTMYISRCIFVALSAPNTPE